MTNQIITPDEKSNENNQAHQSSIAQTYQPKKRWGVAIMILIIPVILLGAIYFGFSSYQNHKAQVKAEKKSQKVVAEKKGKILGVESELPTPQPIESELPTPQPIEPIPLTTQTQSNSKPSINVEAIPNRFDSPMLMSKSDNNGLSGTSFNKSIIEETPSYPVKSITQRDEAPLLSGANDQSSQGMRLTPTATPKTQATLLGRRDFILARGTKSDCVLNTAIISTIPGMVTCTITENLYSSNGKVLLVERGSTASGEYTGLKNGESRLNVLLSRIETSEGVVVDINSLGTDALGRTGLNGEIDQHWSERIGMALFVSTFKDVIAYQTAKDSQANAATQSYQNIQNTGGDIANQILRQTLNNQPTLIKNHGDRIAIVVARDLDFRGVYQLTLNNEESTND